MRKASVRIEQCHHCKGPLDPDAATRVQVPIGLPRKWYKVVLLCGKCTMDRKLTETMKGTLIK